MQCIWAACAITKRKERKSTQKDAAVGKVQRGRINVFIDWNLNLDISLRDITFI